MKYSGILLDIDDTLYDYRKAHDSALNEVVRYAELNFKIEKKSFLESYYKGRSLTNKDLALTAASHNRLLYFQKTLEDLNINSLKHSLKFYDLYWNTFLNNIILFDGVVDFLEKYKNKICLLTDLTSHIQFRKVHHMKLENYINLIVTSEEVGVEKPNKKMFQKGLMKLALKKNQVCVIGDNFNKDILGAIDCEIESIWLNHENIPKKINNKLIKQVNTFKEILKLV